MRLHPISFALLLSLALPVGAFASGPEDLSTLLQPAEYAHSDRLDILNLLNAYSHAADGLHTDLFGELFTEDAVFTVMPHGADPTSGAQTMGRGRKAIVEALRPRHVEFRKSETQRRHFLTNPIVWNQTEATADVSVYLQLRTSTRGGPSKLVATGRYQGRVTRTALGWRISEWTIYADQALD